MNKILYFFILSILFAQFMSECTGNENCQDLDSNLSGGKCYFDGGKCAEAASCENVEETTLSEDDLGNLCSMFNEDTKNCVPDGKKCKLVVKNPTGGDDTGNNKDENKEKENEKEGEKEKDGDKTGTNNSKNSCQALNFSLALLFLILVI